MSTSQKIDPSILALLISTIGAMILNLRIKINRNSTTGLYQFWLDFQKQIKDDPELMDKIQKVVDESKEKGAKK